jgi:hypothetical protein
MLRLRVVGNAREKTRVVIVAAAVAHYQASLRITKCEFRDGIDARPLFLLHPKLSVAASVESLGANYLTEYTHVA